MGLSPQIFIEQLPQVRHWGSWMSGHQPSSQWYTPEGLPKGFKIDKMLRVQRSKESFLNDENPRKLHVGSQI